MPPRHQRYRLNMHLAERLDLPAGYVARPYRGSADHAAMTAVLAAYRDHIGDPEMPTLEAFDAGYAHLTDCDPANDIALIETIHGDLIGYIRPHRADLDTGVRECGAFSPTRPEHNAEPLFQALLDAQEQHTLGWADDAEHARHSAYSAHPGPGLAPSGEAAWLENRGYTATQWGASLVRPNLDDIPDRRLPDGVELRPVEQSQIRQILEADWEAFRGEWDFREATESDIESRLTEPNVDPSLWKIAWAGDLVVGQVKSYINAEENEARGYLRGYTEYISTHCDWRNRGVAGALLTMSLHELSDRGMTEAALGVDTNNPGGAFELYTSLGFELQAYEAVYTKPIKGDVDEANVAVR
jgi:mycothiol synthase